MRYRGFAVVKTDLLIFFKSKQTCPLQLWWERDRALQGSTIIGAFIALEMFRVKNVIEKVLSVIVELDHASETTLALMPRLTLVNTEE